VSGRHNNWFDKKTEKRMAEMDEHHEP
jgi:multiple sugar transport system ATP-binding protein